MAKKIKFDTLSYAHQRSLVLDLASRFADGRLSAAKILEASDEELAEMLIAVRGIGKVRLTSHHSIH